MTAGAVLPATMRAAVMYDVDDIRIEERPLPALAAGDVLVRTGASGVCSGDLMPWYVRKKAPFVFGHEPAGTVVALGPPIDGNASVHEIAAPELALGDRVFAHHHAPCLSCETCRCGRFVQCATWRATALEPGGMSEYFRVPHANLVDTLRLPAAVSFVDASLVEPLGCVVKSLRRALAIAPARSLVPHDSDAVDLRGTTVYVIGAGVMGLMHVAVAAALGATVYASDYHASRRDVARALGAADAFEPASAQAALVAATGNRLADTTICGPGAPAALEAAVAATAPDGTVLMFTPIEPHERFAFDQSTAYFRDLRLVSSYSAGPTDTREALRLIAAGVVTTERLRASEFAFPAVDDAYVQMRDARVVKAIVTFRSPSYLEP
ncbi:MAG: zinc-dependent dehydrogenase [Vulcanimicrobiaceae bacterium]